MPEELCQHCHKKEALIELIDVNDAPDGSRIYIRLNLCLDCWGKIMEAAGGQDTEETPND